MQNTAAKQMLHVVAAVIQDSKDRVLITRRPRHVHQGGLWEFPGGKVEEGESAHAALRRELHEELDIDVQQATPLLKLRHNYPDKAILLDVWRVHSFVGKPCGKEGQPLRYKYAHELEPAEFPAANHAIIRTLGLPTVYAISSASRVGVEAFLQQLGRALEGGLKLLQLRERNFEPGTFMDLAGKVIGQCHARNARVLINDDPETAVKLGADGVHLNSHRLMQLKARPLPANLWVGASCHDARELAQAVTIGADFAVLSPVLPTPSHPGADHLGWSRFEELLRNAAIPVYALGGMKPDYLSKAISHGAIGCAMLSQYWEQFQSANSVD